MTAKGILSNIKQIRNDRKLTQREVSLRLNICLFSYSRIENGLVDVKFSRLEQIAAVFEITVMELINWNHSPKSDPGQPDLNAKSELYDTEILNLRRTIISLNEELYFMNSEKLTISG